MVAYIKFNIPITENKLIENVNLFSILKTESIRKIFSHLSLSQYPVLQLVDKRWKKITDSLCPYFLFHIINFLMIHCGVEFVRCASTTIGKKISVNKAQSNCFYNMLAISTIPSGQEKARRIIDFILMNYNVHFPSTLQIKKETINVNLMLCDLLSGPLLVLKNQNKLNEENKADLEAKLFLVSKDFNLHLDLLIKKSIYKLSEDIVKCRRKTLKKFNLLMNQIEFDFNKNTINSLESEIFHNLSKIDQKISAIYYLAIAWPNPDSLAEYQFVYYHCFAIEQYFSPLKKECLFRIYQSNIDQLTLKEYFDIKKYASFSDEGCLNFERMSYFFTDLKLILNGVNGSIEDLCKRCFESLLPKLSSTFYNVEKQILYGLSLRYKTEMFNPKDCVKNLFAFMGNNKAGLPDFNLEQL